MQDFIPHSFALQPIPFYSLIRTANDFIPHSFAHQPIPFYSLIRTANLCPPSVNKQGALTSVALRTHLSHSPHPFDNPHMVPQTPPLSRHFWLVGTPGAPRIIMAAKPLAATKAKQCRPVLSYRTTKLKIFTS